MMKSIYYNETFKYMNTFYSLSQSFIYSTSFIYIRIKRITMEIKNIQSNVSDLSNKRIKPVNVINTTK